MERKIKKALKVEVNTKKRRERSEEADFRGGLPTSDNLIAQIL